MTQLAAWLRTALIDLRGDLRQFGVLLACLALGVATITAVGSVGSALTAAVNRDARVVLGGDLEAQLSYRAALPEELALFQDLGRMTAVTEVAGRARGPTGSTFIAIRAVDSAYPLVGQVVVSEAATSDLDVLLEARNGVFGAVADSLLVDRLALKPGDTFSVGPARYEVRGLIESVPDQVTQGVQLGVPVILSQAGLAAAEILRPGILARYRYKVVLDDLDYPAAADTIRTAFPDAAWQVKNPAEATADLAEFFDLFSRFLIIVGLSSLLVGGVGVSNAVSAYVTERERSIATLRSLGATSARILTHFLTQIMVLTLLGILIGVVVGTALTFIALPIVGDLLDIVLDAAIDPISMAIASTFGVLIGFAFAYIPLARAQRLKPAMLFRSVGVSHEGRLTLRDFLRPSLTLPVVVAFLGVVALALFITQRPVLVAWYTGGAIGGLVGLWFAGLGLQYVLRRLPPAPLPALRNAIRSIHRPGALAPAVIISLGLGLSLLISISLLDMNLRGQITRSIIENAPTFVLVDLFQDEVEDLTRLAARDDRIERFEAIPMMRAAITKVKDTPRAQLGDLPETVSYMFEGEAPMTWLRRVPDGSKVVEGQWWPADYKGPPLVSLSLRFKEPLGLEIGDTIELAIFGEPVTATIASFRSIVWTGGSVNFSVVLSPGYVENYPITQLGLLKTAPSAERAVQTMLVDTYPELVFLPVGDALALISAILSSLANAISVVGGLAVVGGLLVLAGAMAAGRRQREAEAVVMKVLGATRGDVVRAFIVEYGLLGALAALVAAVLGIAGAWGLATELLDIDFAVDPLLIVNVTVGAVVLAIAVGVAMTWRALSVRPAHYLRGE